jgi:hypothetical protein
MWRFEVEFGEMKIVECSCSFEDGMKFEELKGFLEFSGYTD